jgi:hypothetical protein
VVTVAPGGVLHKRLYGASVIALALALYGLVALAERRALTWQQRSEEL